MFHEIILYLCPHFKASGISHIVSSLPIEHMLAKRVTTTLHGSTEDD